MAGGMYRALYDKINQKPRDHVFINSSSRSILKVPNHLRQINEKAYEPQVISIGPYHRGKDHLKAMEVQKMNSLKLVLDQGREHKVEAYVIALEEMEKYARNFYSEPLDHISREEFVEMMLLDACFIIELIFYSTTEKLFTPFILKKVMRDLLLLENQLPFFVLSKLYSLSDCQQFDDIENRNNIACMAKAFLLTIVPGLPIIERSSYKDAEHLLGLVHYLSYSEEEERPDLPSIHEEVETPHSGSSSMSRVVEVETPHAKRVTGSGSGNTSRGLLKHATGSGSGKTSRGHTHIRGRGKI
ncbi:hypothetical protein SLEP1_g57318 [Rubroshorea leprosula]|uniref:Uncharacterized protein n=1 Tax=Rubroshorea leprosula TaxID=152421 RepID=A0AAV5MPV2_9ROSI|nr:hypothetical protein SLEP1_g57318 [Rubroshorea leprosula]